MASVTSDYHLPRISSYITTFRRLGRGGWGRGSAGADLQDNGDNFDNYVSGTLPFQLRFDRIIFNPSTSPNCSSVYLEIVNGGLASSPSAAKYCSGTPPVFKSQSNEIRVIFYAGPEALAARGFRLTYNFESAGKKLLTVMSFPLFQTSCRFLLWLWCCPWDYFSGVNIFVAINVAMFMSRE